jgi:type IV secretory pathway TrbF-like protein
MTPPQTADIHSPALSASRQFAEVYGAALTWNTYLKLLLAGALLVIAALVGLVFRTEAHYANVKPLVIRIDEVGRADAISYDMASTYQPRAPELRYFLTQFVEKHFGRERAVIARDFGESLFFLERSLAAAKLDEFKKANVVQTLFNGTAEEVAIAVKNVALRDIIRTPFQATVDFEEAFSTSGSHVATRRQAAVAQIEFRVGSTVPEDFIKVNPLGIVITDFRVDRAFHAEKAQ